MSHLAHIIKVKEQMASEGITCPMKQSELLTEAYVRAVVRFRYSNGNNSWSEAVDSRTWEMLEKWNNVTPIKAQFIHTSAVKRCNEVLTSLAQDGLPPCRDQYAVNVEIGEGQNVDISKWDSYTALSSYLFKEMVANHE